MTRRLFVAVDLAAPVLGRVADALAQVRGLAAQARWAGTEAGHVTLAFLGAVPADRVAEIGAALPAVARHHRTFTLAVRGSGLFGGPRRPRVLWAGVGGDVTALRSLQATVDAALRDLGLALESRRPFHPHLTLARARSPRGEPGLAAAAAALAEVGFGEQRVDEFALYESHPGPAGARHERILGCRLGG